MKTLVWKELREQWVVWLTLAVATVGGVATLQAFLSSDRYRDEMLVGALWLSVWGYGLVCGALLLAGEAEEGTQAFLDTLPGTRGRLWRVKAGTGLGLLAALATVLGLAEVILLIRVRALPWAGVGLFGGLLYGAIGYGWGLYGGSRSATVLGAIGRGAAIQVFLSVAAFPFVVLTLQFLFRVNESGPQLMALTGVLTLATAWPAVRSRFNYCHADWQRVPPPDRRAGEPVRMDWGEAFGLAAREARWLAVGMGAFGLIGTVAVTALGAFAWPVTTVLIGVLCGVTAFSHAKQAGAGGGGRVSPGRLAVARVSVRFAIAVAAAVLTASVPLALLVKQLETVGQLELQELEAQLRVGTTAGLVQQPFLFLFLGLATGFAVGLLCGAWIRPSLLAGLVAVPCACASGLTWLPDLLLGETLAAWQAWGPPAVLLLAASVLMALQIGGRPSRLRASGVALCGMVLAAAWSGAALWLRAAEIASPQYAVDVEAYRASLPSGGEDEGRRLTAGALLRLRVVSPVTFVDPGLAPPSRNLFTPEVLERATLVTAVASHGWRDDNARRLAIFLDGVFRDPWSRDLARAAELPTTVLVDPRGTRLGSPLPELAASRDAVVLLVARGLQRQYEGHPEEFVDQLRTGLALSRSLRHRTVSRALAVSAELEARMGRGVDLWLDGLQGRPDLLRRVLDVLQAHALAPRGDREDAREADFLVAVNTVSDPVRSLSELLVPFAPVVVGGEAEDGHNPDDFFTADFLELPFHAFERPLPPGLHMWSAAPGDAELIRLAFLAPWERARLRRMLEDVENSGSSWKLVRLRRSLEAPTIPSLRLVAGAPPVPSQLERVVERLAPFIAAYGSLRGQFDPDRNRCAGAERRVADRLKAEQAR